jgi:putative ABC transport system permease protein
VNRPTARLLFGSEDVVGRTLTVGESGSLTLEIVGVVEGVHHWGPTEGVEEAVYVPYARLGTGFDELEVLVRTDSDTGTAAAALRDAIWALDPNLPVPEVTTMERRVSASLATPRFLAGLLGGFAAVALLLACGGIYGSMLYTVGQRRREMGIRLALGAAAPDIVRLVLRYGVTLAVAGVVLGTLTGLAISRVMEGLLWGVEPTDGVTFAAMAVLLGSSAVSAALVPAWRAGRTDPLQTLKTE